MGPTAQLCSHRLHSAARLECRNHCLAAPAGPLLVAIGTACGSQYKFSPTTKEQEGMKIREKETHSGVRLEGQRADELTSRYFAR